MFRIGYVLLCLIFSYYSQAQRETFIGAEIAYSADHHKVSDAGNKIGKPLTSSALFGITIRKMISPRFYLESGVYTREYRKGLVLKDLDRSSYGTGRRVVQLPLRVGARIPFLHNRFFLRPVAGLVVNIATEQIPSSSWGDIDDGDGNIFHYEYDIDYQTEVFFLVQAGLSLDVRLGQRCFLGIAANHYMGLQKIQIQRIKYGMNNDPLSSASTSTRGGFGSIGAVFSYRLGNK